MKIGLFFSEGKAIWSDFLNSERRRLAMSIIITCLIAILTSAISPLAYQVGDDAYYRGVTAGYVTGSPNAHTWFTGYALAYLIALLYTFASNIPWYDLVGLGIILLSSVAFNKSLLKAIARTRAHVVVSLVLLLLANMALFVYPIAIMNFSTTSLIAGAAASITLLELGTMDNESSRVKIFDSCLVAVLLALSLEWRLLMFELSVCFAGMIAICRWVFDRKSRKLIAGVVSISLIATVPLLIINYAAYADPAWQEYIAFNRARAQFMDYGHFPYESARELYEEYNWTPEMLKLVENKFLMDKAITTESLASLSDHEQSVVSGLRYLWSFIKARPMVQGYCFSGFILAVILLVKWVVLSIQGDEEFVQGRARCDIFQTVLICFGTIATLLYCSWKGNLYLRHFIGLMLFPFGAIIRSWFLTARYKKVYRSSIFEGLTFAACVLLVLIPVKMTLNVIANQTRVMQITTRDDTYTTLLDYTSRRKENIYIGSIYPSFKLFRVEERDRESNYYFWGHFQSMMYSPLFYEKIENNDIDKEMYSDILLRDDAYYVGTNPELAEILLSYMEQRYHLELKWVIVDSLPIEDVKTCGSNYIEETFDAKKYSEDTIVLEKRIDVMKIEVENAGKRN